MTEVAQVLAKLGLSCYTDSFIAEGFDNWATLLDITESDLFDLNVKLGHRRKLQRAIIEHRQETRNFGRLDTSKIPPEETPVGRPSPELTTATRKLSEETGRTKRKYKRHPKPDLNAPERPPSAYVIFSNDMRSELKAHDYSFTQMAKVVGERWQQLSPGLRERHEQDASILKERYIADMAEYKRTENYHRYSEYLADFKARERAQESEEKRCKVECTSTPSSHDVSETAPAHDRRKSVASVYSSESTPGDIINTPEDHCTPTSPPVGYFLGVQYRVKREQQNPSHSLESPISTSTSPPTGRLPVHSKVDTPPVRGEIRYYTRYENPERAVVRLNPSPPPTLSHDSKSQAQTQPDGYALHRRPLNLPASVDSARSSIQAMMDIDSPRYRRVLPTPLSGRPVESEPGCVLRPAMWASEVRDDARASFAVLLRAGESLREAETAQTPGTPQ